MRTRGPSLVALACLTSGIGTWSSGPLNAESSSSQPKSHWAFHPPRPPALPILQTQPAPNLNPIDRFILARLELERIRPAAPADPHTLLRRLSLDLTGVPPSPTEVEAFLHDPSPDAYERLVDRLLASPHYGERWGRWWLDAARYADSNGYSIDAPRSVWKYRDWVVGAFNRDLPFDQFTVEQLAGDLLPNPTLDQRVATGFNRNTQINQEGGIDPEQFRVESVLDRVNTVGTVFLGLTVGCAQCHDHKYDPLTQLDYYRLYAFFNQSIEEGHGKGSPSAALEIPGAFESGANLKGDREEAAQDLDRYLNTYGKDQQQWESSLRESARAQLKTELQEILDIPFADRSPEQKRLAYAAFRPKDPEFQSRLSRLTKLEKAKAKPVTTLVMEEDKKSRPSTIFIKGDFTRPGEPVTPGTPKVLHPFHPESISDSATPNRLDLARWMVDPANPLTARVLVNRTWQQFFGRGLVETENDFGTQGTPPSHPDLLDFLACEFVRCGWSFKQLHRLIVTSAAYRQSSKARPELQQLDPQNKLLARQNRVRFDAELVRDSALAASGLLCRDLGGPPVFPPQPEGVMTLGQIKRDWTPSTGSARYRRALYTHFWRATPHPALMVFDAPDAFSTCTRRLRSNTPLQALTLLNDPQFYEMAVALAQLLQQYPAPSDSEKLRYAFQRCLARSPVPTEESKLLDLLESERRDPQAAYSSAPHLPWIAVARVLLNLDEFITRE